MIQQTSLEAYEEVRKNLGTKQTMVYNALKEMKEANNQMISVFLNIPINSVTPRVKELREKRLVGVAFVGPDLNTGRQTIYWRVVK